VEVDASRHGYLVNSHEIVRRGRTGELYPPKTTRHRFPSPFPICNISVLLLQGQSAIAFSPASAHFASRYTATTVEAANDRYSARGGGYSVHGEAS
jgi:hypothetical protein